jgi:hypothetical protein
VVGVGSVGTRAWIFLLEGGMESEALLLQGKQAEASALAGYAGDSDHANQGERVVAASGSCRPWKLSAEIELMRPQSMGLYARLCGWTLARAHARSGDRIASPAGSTGSATSCRSGLRRC